MVRDGTKEQRKDERMKVFKAGTEYTARSIGDYKCIFRFTVTGRSKRFITVLDHLDKVTRRVGIMEYNGGETAFPAGRFSFAPIIRAEEHDNSAPEAK